MSSRRSGFTFVELLIAMMVFGILSAVALPKYRLMKEKAYTAALKADLGELRIAEESFWAENHAYTTDRSLLDWRPTSDVLVTISSGDPNGGWQATAYHMAMQGRQCSTAVGTQAVAGIPSGEITCGALVGPPPGNATPTN